MHHGQRPTDRLNPQSDCSGPLRLAPAPAPTLSTTDSAAVDALPARIAELEEAGKKQRARIQCLETTITKLEETVAAQKSQPISASETADLTAQLAAKDARIAELEAQVAALASAEEGVPPDP